jgi:hypothetical protein
MYKWIRSIQKRSNVDFAAEHSSLRIEGSLHPSTASDSAYICLLQQAFPLPFSPAPRFSSSLYLFAVPIMQTSLPSLTSNDAHAIYPAAMSYTGHNIVQPLDNDYDFSTASSAGAASALQARQPPTYTSSSFTDETLCTPIYTPSGEADINHHFSEDYLEKSWSRMQSFHGESGKTANFFSGSGSGYPGLLHPHSIDALKPLNPYWMSPYDAIEYTRPDRQQDFRREAYPRSTPLPALQTIPSSSSSRPQESEKEQAQFDQCSGQDFASFDVEANQSGGQGNFTLEGFDPKTGRARNACTRCHKSKAKCTVEKPTCSKCLKNGFECVYPDFVRRRGKAKNPKSDHDKISRKKTEKMKSSCNAGI